jgi:multidrug efflux system membrane fusion protein
LIDNIVDRATGTIRLKATFANEDRRLWPGLFVHVSLRRATLSDVVVVPAAAVQTGQQGSYVFVIDAQDMAEMRPVSTGVTVGGDVVMLQGVTAGDRVVTDGQLRLVPGARVSVRKEVSPSSAPAKAQQPPADESSADTSPAESPGPPSSAETGGSGAS